jgi:hypothetical protein
MEAARPSGTLILIYKILRCHIREDHDFTGQLVQKYKGTYTHTFSMTTTQTYSLLNEAEETIHTYDRRPHLTQLYYVIYESITGNIPSNQR